MGDCVIYYILCSVERASLYNLVYENKLLHNLFSVYFVNSSYNFYMFLTSLWYAECIPDNQLYNTSSTNCRINRVVPTDDGPEEVRNM